LIKHILGNGVRVVAEPVPSSRSVSIGIWVKAGSRYESPHRNGISHLIEHMLFKGTEKYSAKDIANIFDGIGGNVNAFTSREYTCYYAKVLDEHLELASEALSEMLLRSVLDEEELRKEKDVIGEEIAMYEDTPDDYVHDLVVEAAYGDHPLAYSILGTPDSLAPITPADLREYMGETYHAGRIVISAAGHIDSGFGERMETYFGTVPASGSGREPVGEMPAFLGETRFREKDTEQHHLCLALPGLPFNDEHLHAMILLNNIIGGGMSSRLFQEIRENRGLAYSIFSYHSAHADSGLFTIYAGTHPNQTEEVCKLTLDILGELAVKGITEEELSRGKEQLKGSIILGLESTSSRMNRLGKNELMLGRHESLDDLIRRIEQIDMKEIRIVLDRMFSRPFAAALVGSGDEALQQIRRDQYVIRSADSAASGQ
jgi:Predicted Zn-dependent peptidases